MPVYDNPLDPPPRVKARPDPSQWELDDPLTFGEAAALLWPQGPITASTLRTAYRQGHLDVLMVARKVLVTRRLLAAWLEASRRTRGVGDGRDSK